MNYLCNAFSSGMLHLDQEGTTVRFKEVNLDTIKEILNSEEWMSAVGHSQTAQLLSELLEKDIPTNRISLQLKPGDKALVFQLGTRIPEGTILSKEEIMSLPTKWILAEVVG